MNNTKYEKIKYKNKYFVYDTSSNKIIQIDKNIYSFLDDYFKLKTKELKDKSKNYDELIKQINKLERQGFFMPLIKKDFSSKILDENFIEKKLKKGISKLVLEITQKCNLRCYYCKYSGSYEGERKHTNQSMKYMGDNFFSAKNFNIFYQFYILPHHLHLNTSRLPDLL